MLVVLLLAGLRASSMKLEMRLVETEGMVAPKEGVCGTEDDGVDWARETVECRWDGVFGAGGKEGWWETYWWRKLVCSWMVGYLDTVHA
jgi:hypothetical protein